MLYYLSKYLNEIGCDFPGKNLMSYITIRSGLAFVLSLLIAIFIGRRIIDALSAHQVGEKVRDLGLPGEESKKNTPTMGGIIIIISILVPCLLVSNIGNTYMVLLLVSTVWLSVMGFLDDYLKLKYKNKDGLKPKYKIIGQLGLAVVVAGTMYLNPNMVIVQNHEVLDAETHEIEMVVYEEGNEIHAPETTIPFVKNNNFSYASITSFLGEHAETGGWVVFFLVTLFLVTATSNGANLLDGLDGLCTGVSAINGVALAIMAYLGSNVIYSSYLNIMYIPGSEEIVVYMMAFIGALIGFLWYNTSKAEVFMGDTGSLMLGGIICVIAILIHKELLLPILCAIFYVEDLSSLVQTLYYKRTKRRLLRCAPIHHHYQKANPEAIIQWPRNLIVEQKLVTRFWIVAILLAVVTFVTLKIR